MEINCEQIVEKYLLNQNPLYAFSFPISLLVAIIVFGFSKAYKWSDNSYVNQILIPILTFLLTMILIDQIARLMIPIEKKIKLVQLCKMWMHDPSVKNHPILSRMIDMDLVSRYTGNIENLDAEHFSNYVSNYITKQEIKEEIVEPIEENSKLAPFPIQFREVDSKCIENSNCCNLCSGTGENPCNIIAPIPGPQWLPQSAEAVQNRLKNNDYTPSTCP
jgi:hypothetical protein